MRTGLNDIGARLAALPGFEAPAGGWQAVLAARRRRACASSPHWPVLLAASVLATAVGLAWFLQAAHQRSATAQQPVPAPASIVEDAIRKENTRLETLLAALPEQRAMRGSTAFTVAQIEDRLALVDDRLSRIALEPNAPEHAERLWRERVELMNSLVQVRYADVTGSL